MKLSHSPSVIPFAFLLLVTMTAAEGCRAVEGIFKAGFFVGIFLAVIVVGVLFAVFSRMRS